MNERLVKGLNESPSQFHAVDYCKRELKENGFEEVEETGKWKLEGGKGYFFSRNESTLVAFVVGKQVPKNGIELYKIIGCHTDSPVLKIAPISKK